MALCESQLDNLHQIKSETDSGPDTPENEKKPPPIPHPVAPNLTVPLAVDYRSPRAHFVPPEVELYAVQSRRLPSSSQESGSNTSLSTIGSNASGVLVKRKRGRPRIDKTSPEYLAKSAARKQAREMVAMMNSSSDSIEKRKRGRPRIDKTSPEYLARKRARELEAMEKRAKRQFKRRTTGAKIVTKSSKSGTKVTTAASRVIKKVPLKGKTKLVGKNARQMPQKGGKNARQLLPQKGGKNARQLLPQKVGKSRKPTAKERVVVMRRNTKFVKRKKDSASSSTGDTTPRAKRKYTKRPGASGGAAGAGGDTPKKRGRKKKMILGPDGQPMTPPPKVKGKRGRPRKLDASGADRANANSKPPLQQAKIRVRNNLMPINNEPIPVDSEDEPDLGSPSRASDSLSLDENLRALRHLHEKYANIGKDDLYQTHLLAANFKSPGPPPSGDGYPGPGAHDDDEVLSVRSSPGREEAGKVEKLEDSSDSDSDDSSSSESGSTSSGSSSSSSSGSSSSSDSSDSESEKNGPAAAVVPATALPLGEDRSFGSWSHNSASRSPRSDDSGSGSGAEGGRADAYGDERGASLSESENESPDKSFQCNVCKKWYSTSVTLKIHRRVHVTRGAGNSKSRARSKDRYECDCCDEVFTRREKLLEHRAVAHRGAMTVRCEVCRRCFEDDAELAAHDRTHTHDERAGRCSDCGASFPRYELLRRHRACAHPREARGATQREAGGRHTCRQCGKGFGHAHSLTRHLHNHAKQLYRCVVCKASFARADQLAQHLNSHLANYKRLKS